MNLVFLLCLTFVAKAAIAQTIMKVSTRGNKKVEADAIVTILKTKAGNVLNPKTVRDDIYTLYDLGYFSNIAVYKKAMPGGVEVVVEVEEKPAITAISYVGLDEVSEDDIAEKMETKLYSILNETTITADMRMIEALYIEKGFYLAQVNYHLEEDGENEVKLVFTINESGKVLVGDVNIIGNKYFTDKQIVEKLASQPHTRSASFSSSSLFQIEKVKRDLEFLSYYYRDSGFAEVKVAKPITLLDKDRKFVRITFQVEEGIQYRINKIDVSGDVLFPKKELFDAMKLKKDELFRYTWFAQHDIEMLVDKYGDLGYAYVDVNPKTRFNKEKKTVDINYVITKGEKVYFGEMTVVGNTKTRDNVIRREFEIAESERYSGTRLIKSKSNVTRLGFFDEVQVLKERDAEVENLLNLKVRVKEGNTGQVQAAFGYTPKTDTAAGFSGQLNFNEKNLVGKSWRNNISAKWSGGNNYDLNAGFVNPRINNGQWSLGLNAGYSRTTKDYGFGVEFDEERRSFGVVLGRKIIELVRGSIGYSLSNTKQTTDQYVLDRFRTDGTKSSVYAEVSRKDYDNYLDPTDGLGLSLKHKYTGGNILRGDYEFMETTANASYYYPIDFTDTFRTFFKFNLVSSVLWQVNHKTIPFGERYRLGGPGNMRGYRFNSISPTFRSMFSPGGASVDYKKGGDRQLYLQAEYYVPFIESVGIKALVFADVGRVYDDNEKIVFNDFKKDVGFGLRWITPMAPLRFEWAFPIKDDGTLGQLMPIIRFGY